MRTTNKELAARYGTSARTIQRWRNAGIDVANPESVKTHRRHLQSREPATVTPDVTPDPIGEDFDYFTARAKRTHFQALKAQREVEILDGKYTADADVLEVLQRSGAILKAALASMVGNLPGELIGLSPAAMSRRLTEATDQALDLVYAEMGKPVSYTHLRRRRC